MKKRVNVLQHLSGTILTTFIFFLLVVDLERFSEFISGSFIILLIATEFASLFVAWVIYGNRRNRVTLSSVNAAEKLQPYLVILVGSLYLAYAILGTYVHVGFIALFFSLQVCMRFLEGVKVNNIYTTHITLATFFLVFLFVGTKEEGGAIGFEPEQTVLACFIYFVLYGLLQLVFLSPHFKLGRQFIKS